MKIFCLLPVEWEGEQFPVVSVGVTFESAVVLNGKLHIACHRDCGQEGRVRKRIIVLGVDENVQTAFPDESKMRCIGVVARKSNIVRHVSDGRADLPGQVVEQHEDAVAVYTDGVEYMANYQPAVRQTSQPVVISDKKPGRTVPGRSVGTLTRR